MGGTRKRRVMDEWRVHRRPKGREDAFQSTAEGSALGRGKRSKGEEEKKGRGRWALVGRRAYLKNILTNNLSFLYELEGKALCQGHDGRCG